MQTEACCEIASGTIRYAASMLKVAAKQPSGSERISVAVSLNKPQLVGKQSGFIPALIDGVVGLPLGNERSCMIQNLVEFGLGITPSGAVQKGPIKASSSEGVKPLE